jgi:stage II sporulation protein D
MCQWGAKAMAEQGYTARQILEFYYPGTTPGIFERTAR